MGGNDHGKNLADYVDSKGQPTAGTWLDYPSHLGAAFRTLDWYGKEMRERHGKGTRRNIKFDDDEETMYIDVCLPNEDYWHRVSIEEAKRHKSERDEERISSSRRSLEGPRPSLSSVSSVGSPTRGPSPRDRLNSDYQSPERRR